MTLTNLSDAKGTLDKLTSWVKGQGEKQQNRKAPWAWVTTLIVGAVALLAVGFMYYRSWKQGRELAKLKHERDVREEEAVQAKVAEGMAVTDRQIAEHKVEVRRTESRLERLDQELEKITNEATATRFVIDALKNWDDVDRYLSSGSDDSDGPGPV